MSLVEELRPKIKSKSIILSETIPHEVTFKTFHHLFRYAEERTKWGNLSQETKENIFMFFEYLRGLSEIQDPEHFSDWNYWQEWAISFMRHFDDANPRYSECFEKCVLGVKQ